MTAPSGMVVKTNAEEVIKNLNARAKGLRPAMRNAGKEFGKLAIPVMEQTTDTWHHKPEFKAEVLIHGGNLETLVATPDPVWNILNEGAPPHPIESRGPWPLKFQSGYNAKTAPGVMRSRTGGPFGDVIRARRVNHPGIDARRWSEKAVKLLRPDALEILRKWINKWLDKQE